VKHPVNSALYTGLITLYGPAFTNTII